MRVTIKGKHRTKKVKSITNSREETTFAAIIERSMADWGCRWLKVGNYNLSP